MTKSIKVHHDGTPAPLNAVFVFGSNLRGHHGAGAARHAMDHLGYPYGQHEGIGGHGRAYAIPTKDEGIETLPIALIQPFVERFAHFTLINPQMEFFVTRVGCVLAGHRDEDMARLFRECGPNCSFAHEWLPFL